jgi:hypothetical protein
MRMEAKNTDATDPDANADPKHCILYSKLEFDKYRYYSCALENLAQIAIAIHCAECFFTLKSSKLATSLTVRYAIPGR